MEVKENKLPNYQFSSINKTSPLLYKSYLFSIAYRMLGSVQDAEDILQDTYLAWLAMDQSKVNNTKTYLTKVVVNRSVKLLEQRKKQRVNYIGPWLPEPLVESLYSIEQAETLSYSFLLLLEKLTPTERAVFLLHKVFDWQYEAIATAFELTNANCRQLGHRAQEKIKSDKKRFIANTQQKEHFKTVFINACQTGVFDELFQHLKEEVILYGDGGGKVLAGLKPIFGRTKVLRFFTAILPKMPADVKLIVTMMNGSPSIIAIEKGKIINVMIMEVEGEGISNIYAVRNPDKLKHLEVGALIFKVIE